MTFRPLILSMTVSVLFMALSPHAQPRLSQRGIQYRPGDWVSYPVMRFATCVTGDFRTVYFGTTHGIARYDLYSNAWLEPFTFSDGLEKGKVRLLAYDYQTGRLWAAMETGLNLLDPASNQWLFLSFGQIGVDSVTSIGFGARQAWLESTGRYYQGSRFGGPFFQSQKNEADQDNAEWQGTLRTGRVAVPQVFMENGLLLLPDGSFQDRELRRYQITDTFADRFDRLWVSVWGLGAVQCGLKTFQGRHLPVGPYIPSVNAMAWDEDGMWVGGVPPENSGSSAISYLEDQTGGWSYFDPMAVTALKNADVTSVAVNGDRIFFGTKDGLAIHDRKTGNWWRKDVFSNLWSNAVNRISLGDSLLWVATDDGINKISLPSLRVERVEDPRLLHRIYDIAADGDGAWVCTDRGIFRYQAFRGAWEAVAGWPGIISHTITAVCATEKEVWFGTGDGAQVYYKKEDRWEGFPAFHYPTGGTIHAIAVDDHSAWLATEDGVLKYKKSEKRWRRFGEEDGLLDRSVLSVLLDGDHVWFGTANGLTRFYWNASYRTD